MGRLCSGCWSRSRWSAGCGRGSGRSVGARGGGCPACPARSGRSGRGVASIGCSPAPYRGIRRRGGWGDRGELRVSSPAGPDGGVALVRGCVRGSGRYVGVGRRDGRLWVVACTGSRSCCLACSSSAGRWSIWSAERSSSPATMLGELGSGRCIAPATRSPCPPRVWPLVPCLRCSGSLGLLVPRSKLRDDVRG